MKVMHFRVQIIIQNNPNIFAAYYWHPKKTSNEVFLNKLKSNLAKLQPNKPIILTGGFNYDILNYEKNPFINEFANFA